VARAHRLRWVDAVAHVDGMGHVIARGPGVTAITARVGAAFATTHVSVSLQDSRGLTLRNVEAAILFK
jgi:hypothetical protein